MALRVGEQQRLGEVGEIFVEAEQLVAPAHALAVGIDRHEDRRSIAPAHHVEDIAREAAGAVDAERRVAVDADHREPAAPERALAADETVRDGDGMALGK